jgi:hypothetical protein
MNSYRPLMRERICFPKLIILILNLTQTTVSFSLYPRPMLTLCCSIRRSGSLRGWASRDAPLAHDAFSANIFHLPEAVFAVEEDDEQEANELPSLSTSLRNFIMVHNTEWSSASRLYPLRSPLISNPLSNQTILYTQKKPLLTSTTSSSSFSVNMKTQLTSFIT